MHHQLRKITLIHLNLSQCSGHQIRVKGPKQTEKERLYLLNLAKDEVQEFASNVPFTYSSNNTSSKILLEDKPPNIDLKSIPGYKRPQKHKTTFDVFESIASVKSKQSGQLACEA